MNAPAAVGKVEKLRARDGDACWLCTRPMDFTAVPNSKKAPTIEHLVPRSLGGGGEMSNLVLTHQACNAHLANRPLSQKEEMRTKWHANAKKSASLKVAGKAHSSKPPVKAVPVPTTPQIAAALDKPSAPWVAESALRGELDYWRRVALIGGGGALVGLGFALGLCTGLLLS
jgi:hypothetical protein